MGRLGNIKMCKNDGRICVFYSRLCGLFGGYKYGQLVMGKSGKKNICARWNLVMCVGVGAQTPTKKGLNTRVFATPYRENKVLRNVHFPKVYLIYFLFCVLWMVSDITDDWPAPTRAVAQVHSYSVGSNHKSLGATVYW